MKTSRKQAEEEAQEAARRAAEAREARENKKREEDVVKAISSLVDVALVDVALARLAQHEPEFRDALRDEFASLKSVPAQKSLIAIAATLETLRTEKKEISLRFEEYKKGVRDTAGLGSPPFGRYF